MSVGIEAGVAERFRAAFRGFPAGVAVVAAAGPDGPVGLTASSVASVSVAPPALSFSVMDSPSARVLAATDRVVVHLLGAGHAGLARDFARAGGPRFTAGQGWRSLPSGEPILPGVPAALYCSVLQRVPVGASTVVVAEVIEAFLGPADGRLIYHDREFLAF